MRHYRRSTDNWSFYQYIESPVRPCPRRGIKWSHVATTFRLSAHTVSSNDSADLVLPSSFMSLVSSRCFCSLSLLSRLVFQEGLLPLPLLSRIHRVTPFPDRWERSSRQLLLTAHVQTCTPATSTQTNPASVSRKSQMLKSGLKTRILALRDASWYQAEFSDHLCCSLISNKSVPLSLAVCIRRSWAPFPLPRLRCRNFTFHPTTFGAPP